MKVAIDEVFYFDAITSNPSTGAASDADSTPTFEVFEEATDTDIGVGGNLTKRTSKTGNYRGSFTASAANGFEAGKWYSVIASATVNSVAGKARVAHFQCVPAESSAGVPKVDVSHISGSAVSTSSAQIGVNIVNAGGTAWASGSLTSGVFASGAITASAIASDAITDAKVASDVTIASVTGAVGSVTGAVGSVTGNVGGNVTGSVGSVATGGISASSFAAGAIDASAIAANAIGASELAADAVTEIAAGISIPTAAQIRAEIDSNSTRLAAIEGDTGTDLPSTLSTIAGYLDTEIAAIKAKTDNLPSDPADASDISSAFGTVNSTLSTIAGYIDTEVASILAAVDTEVAAIKAKTDNLPSDPADASDVAAAITAAWTTALTESYATDGSAATPAQLLYMLWSAVAEFSISGTTITAKKLDGSTTAMTFTVDSATDPTSRTRAT